MVIHSWEIEKEQQTTKLLEKTLLNSELPPNIRRSTSIQAIKQYDLLLYKI